MNLVNRQELALRLFAQWWSCDGNTVIHRLRELRQPYRRLVRRQVARHLLGHERVLAEHASVCPFVRSPRDRRLAFLKATRSLGVRSSVALEAT